MYWSMDSDLRNEAIEGEVSGLKVQHVYWTTTDEEVECVGLWLHRIEKCPLNKSTTKKSLRGSMDLYVSSTKNVIVMQWKGNSIVHVASNCFGLHPTKTA
nr:unnamed protein product [Callosobruchus analis]